MEMIGSGNWIDWKNGYGKFRNPGKKVFLNLADLVVRGNESARDEDDVPLVRKGMIRSGVELNFNGQWEVRHLSPHL